MRTLVPTWGQSLRLAISEYRRGMNGITDVIKFASPRNAVSRTKLSEFYDIESADALSEADKFRAWMVLTALGEDVAHWDLDDTVVDPATNIDVLRERLTETLVHPPGLEPGTHWLTVVGQPTPFKPPATRPGTSGPRNRAA